MRAQSALCLCSVSHNNLLLVCLWKDDEFLGMFVFPIAELSRRGYVDDQRKSIMVYPPWSSPTLQKSKASKAWQDAFFVAPPGFSDTVRLRALFVCGLPQLDASVATSAS